MLSRIQKIWISVIYIPLTYIPLYLSKIDDNQNSSLSSAWTMCNGVILFATAIYLVYSKPPLNRYTYIYYFLIWSNAIVNIVLIFFYQINIAYAVYSAASYILSILFVTIMGVSENHTYMEQNNNMHVQLINV